ncbi:MULTISPECIES: hypothetical protein [Pseudomonas]|uniref:Uncharacterized protein n=1 Tax=Pseudomonas cichorii TaxID=36746 RepID=A0A3M4WF96_PSECI|nr:MULTISPECIES: hypothetical protein [Pseudomonas]AHF69936.1 hypothetical protein PCH70_47830 [Pseudomonas cichorii JBC1]RMR62666.1 hypothetical protein ALP84_02616 [Pseudomonas cichorii]GFM78848.1 hypothetical protein PSCICM_46670 [Pseudomonas cichorii]GFM94383.1 hypothetical protein PSCICP_43550 [Pseudomonas cichorii]
MAARKRTLWKDLRFIVVAVVCLLVAVPGGFSVYQWVWSDAVLCLAEGRMLSDEEHRQRFLESLVRLEVDNSYSYKKHDGNDFLKTGLVEDNGKYDLVRIIQAAKNNGKSFVENFEIKTIAPLREEVAVDYPRPPFVLVSYFDHRGGSSTFTFSRDVVRVKDSPLLRDQLSVYDRVRGFRSHFYKVTSTFVTIECCGTDKYSQTEERYQHIKELAWNSTLASISRGFATHTSLAVSSGCGAVLTEESDSGTGTRHIKRINSGDK